MKLFQISFIFLVLAVSCKNSSDRTMIKTKDGYDVKLFKSVASKIPADGVNVKITLIRKDGKTTSVNAKIKGDGIDPALIHLLTSGELEFLDFVKIAILGTDNVVPVPEPDGCSGCPQGIPGYEKMKVFEEQPEAGCYCF